MPSIRDDRRPRQAARPAPIAHPAPIARPRPDARPLRIAYGMAALAATTALVTALAAPPPAVTATDATQASVTLPAEPAPSVRHVTKYIQLAPGQTAPPNAAVKVVATPKPRVVVVTTRQSGAKP